MIRQLSRQALLVQRLQKGQQRTYAAAAAATSREKRALSKNQLRGEDKAAAAGGGGKAAAAAAPKTGKAAATATAGGSATNAPKASAPPPPAAAGGGGSGGGGSALPILLVVAGAGAGAAYYNDMIPGLPYSNEAESDTEAKVEEKGESQTEEAKETSDEEKKGEEVVEKKTGQTAADGEEETAAATDGEGGNRVVEISLPEGTSRSAPPVAVTEHPADGNKVTMSPSSTTSSPDDKSDGPTVDSALKELQDQISRESSAALSAAHRELAKLSSLDMSEIDTLNETQLKIRLVQMAKDMQDRTKWEAVRLKEFLAMKEREVEDKYVLLLKKQRMEAETTLDFKLNQQKNELTSKAMEELQKKEDMLQSIVDNSLKIQEEQFNEEKANYEKNIEEQMDTKYEQLFGQALSKAKDEFSKRMEQKVKQMESLSKKLADLDYELKTSKDFKDGSILAHRMSAAALALADKLESSKPAGATVNALKDVVVTGAGNAVIAAAVETIPETAITSGIPTLQELQTKFEDNVYTRCRQVAMIPPEQQGLEGQILGMVVSTFKFPPDFDDVAPTTDDPSYEDYVLSRARKFVQLGDLEQAVTQMKLLTGRTAVTGKDWIQNASERVAIEKALKVIRMECALANESMGTAVP